MTTSERKVKGIIKKQFPEGLSWRMTQSGFNVSTEHSWVCFHYRNGSDTGTAVYNSKSVKFNRGEEYLTYLHFTKKPVVEPEINNTVLEVSTNGVQQCIDHIGRKIVLMEKDADRNNTSKIVMLKSLQYELKQYL